MPRYRGAVRASLGVLAVLLVCQAAFPITRVRESRCGWNVLFDRSVTGHHSSSLLYFTALTDVACRILV